MNKDQNKVLQKISINLQEFPQLKIFIKIKHNINRIKIRFQMLDLINLFKKEIMKVELLRIDKIVSLIIQNNNQMY
jgi:cell fate (sporulation/competence/biofilm development) regulator YmcA (YheA/YmcA/DUF963 family)